MTFKWHQRHTNSDNVVKLLYKNDKILSSTLYYEIMSTLFQYLFKTSVHRTNSIRQFWKKHSSENKIDKKITIRFNTWTIR